MQKPTQKIWSNEKFASKYHSIQIEASQSEIDKGMALVRQTFQSHLRKICAIEG